MNERHLKVTAEAQYLAKPDRYTLHLTLSAQAPEYAGALRQGDARLQTLRETLAKAGADLDQLVTEDYSVRPEYIHVEKEGRYEQQLSGYRCTYVMTLPLLPDNDQLTRLLAALAECEAEPELHLSFALQDNKDEALARAQKRAVKKARRDAELLASAAGVTLGQLLSLHYNDEEAGLAVHTDVYAAKRCLAEMADMTPEDIAVRAAVTMNWAIG